MGRRGPKPLPNSIKRARGNPGKRKLNENEPQPEKGLPEKPDYLDEEGSACWERLIPQFERMCILTRIDEHAVAIYCETWSRLRKMMDFIRKHGEVYPILGDDGKIKCMQQFPQVSIAAKLQQALLRLQQEFGMTPSSRSGLAVPLSGRQELDDLDRFVASKPNPLRIANGA